MSWLNWTSAREVKTGPGIDAQVEEFRQHVTGRRAEEINAISQENEERKKAGKPQLSYKEYEALTDWEKIISHEDMERAKQLLRATGWDDGVLDLPPGSQVSKDTVTGMIQIIEAVQRHATKRNFMFSPRASRVVSGTDTQGNPKLWVTRYPEDKRDLFAEVQRQLGGRGIG